MERIAEDFVEEISENFSELLVESFCIRYIGEFPVEEMRRAIKLTEKKIAKKIDIKFNKKLELLDLPPV